MKKVMALLLVPLAVAAVLMLTQGGCEDADTTASLTVEPEFVDLTRTLVTNQDVTVTFAVTDGLRELSLPLSWAVSDKTLGSIVFSGGNTAVYRPITTPAIKSGFNAILVEDQYGAQGMASVAQ